MAADLPASDRAARHEGVAVATARLWTDDLPGLRRVPWPALHGFVAWAAS